MSVIVSRALPDVRDGLKPVHRRILYTMFENNLYPDRAYRKCADTCLLYTSDAADDLLCVDLGGHRINKKKKK